MKIIIKEIKSELDAFSIYSMFKEEKNTVILDSGRDSENLGRYSFIGLNPFLTLKSENGICTLNDKIYEGDTFQCLKHILKKYKMRNDTEFPFIGGGIGYFSYDLGRESEKLPCTAKEDINVPHCYFNFYDNVIIVDNLSNRKYISALGILKDFDSSIEEINERIQYGSEEKYEYSRHREAIDMLMENEEQRNSIFQSNFSRKEYVHGVDKVRYYIRSGDVYITNLTQRFQTYIEKEAFEIYKKLRYINPAPFAAYMNLEDMNIISSSPERFIKIRNKLVETRPIKGTRPRGKTVKEDNENKEALLNSEKDKSELLMIVDLERNDLSRVCKPNTVKVTELFKLEEYSTVYHLVSSVVGEIKDEYNCIDCIKAMFPGGSITGAPKIRSMEIIEEIEGLRRNIYTGCIGYIGFDENVDLNIVIRTILVKDGKAYFGVGGGITWESDCEAEYEETLDKAKALMEALI